MAGALPLTGEARALTAQARASTIQSKASPSRGGPQRQASLLDGEFNEVQFDDCKFKVKVKGEEKQILKGVSGVVYGGEVLAILGPSGAGKTTLLSLLTLDKVGGIPNGEITLNDQVMTSQLFRTDCAYMPQHDHLPAFLSCREALQYTVDLCSDAKPEANRKKVDFLIELLGLKSCEHAKCGNEFFKGLSGGQRRRLSLGLALAQTPRAVFLDEPTSGLDSAAAASITSFLKELAQGTGMVIVCTIHQPSTAVFNGFDKTLILSAGRTAYCGEAVGLVDYLAAIGEPVPPNTNPADFVLDLVNKDFTSAEQVEGLLDKWGEFAAAQTQRSGLRKKTTIRWDSMAPSAFKSEGSPGHFGTPSGERGLAALQQSAAEALQQSPASGEGVLKSAAAGIPNTDKKVKKRVGLPEEVEDKDKDNEALSPQTDRHAQSEGASTQRNVSKMLFGAPRTSQSAFASKFQGVRSSEVVSLIANASEGSKAGDKDNGISVLKDRPTPPNAFRQTWIHLKRQAVLSVRDPMLYYGRAIACLISGIFFAWVYSESRERTQDKIISRIMFGGWILGVAPMFAVINVYAAYSDLQGTKREVKNGIYPIATTLIANMILQIPYMFLLSICCIGVGCYGIMDYNPEELLRMWLLFTLELWGFEVIAQFASVLGTQPLLNMCAFLGMWFGAFLFSGFFIDPEDVVWPLRVFVYMFPLRWAGSSFTQTEFASQTFSGATEVPVTEQNPRGFVCDEGIPVTSCFGRTGAQVLESVHSTFRTIDNQDTYWRDVGYLLAIGCGFKVLHIALTYRRLMQDSKPLKKETRPQTLQTGGGQQSQQQLQPQAQAPQEMDHADAGAGADAHQPAVVSPEGQQQQRDSALSPVAASLNQLEGGQAKGFPGVSNAMQGDVEEEVVAELSQGTPTPKVDSNEEGVVLT
uniref:ABC transporter domain-containing protein n=1 Tax=Chromera velia CCMP2878 TaxID=1169474 RepID=A0A0G4HW09_9ALVE|eukprot:Cvel_8951.t1-p1 / transcript=Cvel_8951.t1 / gene=Cvel_8951 / organism=Chromera_velia_CCMP2878 / gene_product=ABC transporter G family member 22, putative / transcript_product=ABC transporter G family member 22, putative / location=Cvel_scaffold504:51322-58252(+) / protein_length=919 / sequence_SO=supercontig / SO=protein_coding / is_pseudo=false